MPPTKVMIIRHAEKPALVPEKRDGVERDGSQDLELLIVEGWERAGALVRFFAPEDGHFQAKGIARPQKIYAPGIGVGSDSKRPKQTVAALAKLPGLAIDDGFLKGEEAKLAAAILENSGVVLVSWEHKAIHHIVTGLGGDRPPEWPDDRFDMVFVLDRAGDG